MDRRCLYTNISYDMGFMSQGDEWNGGRRYDGDMIRLRITLLTRIIDYTIFLAAAITPSSSPYQSRAVLSLVKYSSSWKLIPT